MTTPSPRRPRRCDAATWERLLAAAELDEVVLRWMVDQATGWPDYEFATRERLYSSLLSSGRDFTAAQLHWFTGRDSAPDWRCALQLLEQPAADVDVVAALLRSVSDGYGGPRFSARLGGNAQYAILGALGEHEDVRVRTMTRVYRSGLGAWHPNWEGVRGLLRGHTVAHHSFRDAMRSLDAVGAWSAAEQLLAGGTPLGPDHVTALVATYR